MMNVNTNDSGAPMNATPDEALRQLVQRAINEAHAAHRDDSARPVNGNGAVSLDELEQGSPGERRFRDFLLRERPAARRVLCMLGQWGQYDPTRPGPVHRPEDHHHRLVSHQGVERARVNNEVVIELLESLPTLPNDLYCGYRRACRRGKDSWLAETLFDTREQQSDDDATA
jgi:hypothetical protein